MSALLTSWIARTLGLDKMEQQRRENDRLVLEIEAQQQADERAARGSEVAHAQR